MTFTSHAIKPMPLAVAIALGFAALHARAEAAETKTLIVAGGCFWCVEADWRFSR